LEGDEIGDVNGRNISGWAFIIKRSLWQEIGGLDESVSFWCSDDCVIEQVRNKGVLPMLVAESIVDHLGSTTFRTVPQHQWDDMTWKEVYTFNKNYNKAKLSDSPHIKIWKEKQGLP